MEKVLYQNSKGVSIVREDFKTRSQVKVVSEFAGKRACLRTYRFNLIHEAVEVPYCSWANLDCCGGWSCDEEYLDTAVQKGLKLFAGITKSLKSEYLPNHPTAEEAKRQFDAMKEAIWCFARNRGHNGGNTRSPYVSMQNGFHIGLY